MYIYIYMLALQNNTIHVCVYIYIYIYKTSQISNKNPFKAVTFITNSSRAIHSLPSVCHLQMCKIERFLNRYFLWGFPSFTLHVEWVRTFFMSDSRTSCFKSFERILMNWIIPWSRGLLGKLIRTISNQIFIATFTRAHHMFPYPNPARAHPSFLNMLLPMILVRNQIRNMLGGETGKITHTCTHTPETRTTENKRTTTSNVSTNHPLP